MQKITLYIVAISLSLGLIAQENIEEQVYVHINSETLITGETLYYSAHCTSALTGLPSLLSRILYIEVLGEKGAIHQAKLELVNGRGQGEFFLSSLITTGKFQLIAYTRWMRNFNTYFQTPLTIINPYESYKVDVLRKTATPLSLQFFPASDKIIANVENTLGFKVSGTSGGNGVKGKIVSDEGETILEFDPDDYGLGKFNFTPKGGLKYEAILEDDGGNLSFYQLPKIHSEGTSIVLTETTSNIEVSINTWPKNGSYGYLIVTDKTNKSRYSINLNATQMIPKADLAEGLTYFKVYGINNLTLAERAYSRDYERVKRPQSSETFGKREEVSLERKIPAGNYSISVRKQPDDLKTAHTHMMTWDVARMIQNTEVPPTEYFLQKNGHPDLEAFLLTTSFKTPRFEKNTITIMPEVRDELLSGRIVKSDGEPAANVTVIFSAPESPYHIRSVISDDNGAFVMPFESAKKPFSAYFCTWPVASDYTIRIDNQFMEKYPPLDYELTPLDTNQIKEIVKQSIRNQIENAYYDVKNDTTIQSNWRSQFFYNNEYVLDDYTRFRTLKETFTEYIFTANVRDSRSPIFKAFFDYNGNQGDYAPLLLLDGVPVLDQKLLMYSPYKVERISVLGKRYFLGSLIVDGVISIETKEGKLDQFSIDEDHTEVELLGVSQIWKSADLANPKPSSSMPDQRDQLLWDPNFKVIDGQNQPIRFFTSDVTGTFEMVIEGHRSDGKAFTHVENFQVR